VVAPPFRVLPVVEVEVGGKSAIVRRRYAQLTLINKGGLPTSGMAVTMRNLKLPRTEKERSGPWGPVRSESELIQIN
jgi:hypothetical protein